MQALSQTKRGESYTIKWMFGIPEVLEFRKGNRRPDKGMRIYSRGQRAKRTCWHVHLATAAGVFDSIMKCSVQRRTKKTSLDAAFLLGILPGVLYNDTRVKRSAHT